MKQNNNNQKGRPKKYVFWDDWQAWLLKEWYPFKSNDFAHLKADVSWLKKLGLALLAMLFLILGAIIATIITA